MVPRREDEVKPNKTNKSKETAALLKQAVDTLNIYSMFVSVHESGSEPVKRMTTASQHITYSKKYIQSQIQVHL